jgi:hypothetical protein
MWRPSSGLVASFGGGRGWNSSVGEGGAFRCGINDSEEIAREQEEENCEDLSCRGKEIVGGGFRLRRQQGIQPIVAFGIILPLMPRKERKVFDTS